MVKHKFLKFVVCNPCESSQSLTIVVPLWFIIISMFLLYISEVLFSGFLQFKDNQLKMPSLSSFKIEIQLNSCGHVCH